MAPSPRNPNPSPSRPLPPHSLHSPSAPSPIQIGSGAFGDAARYPRWSHPVTHRRRCRLPFSVTRPRPRSPSSTSRRRHRRLEEHLAEATSPDAITGLLPLRTSSPSPTSSTAALAPANPGPPPLLPSPSPSCSPWPSRPPAAPLAAPGLAPGRARDRAHRTPTSSPSYDASGPRLATTACTRQARRACYRPGPDATSPLKPASGHPLSPLGAPR